MIYKKKPDHFTSTVVVVGCFVEFQNTFLLLHRQKQDGGTWGLPAGKVEQNEQPREAMIRELREETGISADPKELQFVEMNFIRGSVHDFTFHVFKLTLKDKQEVKLEPAEHQDFCWVTPKEALTLPYIEDLDVYIQDYYATDLKSEHVIV